MRDSVAFRVRFGSAPGKSLRVKGAELELVVTERRAERLGWTRWRAAAGDRPTSTGVTDK